MVCTVIELMRQLMCCGRKKQNKNKLKFLCTLPLGQSQVLVLPELVQTVAWTERVLTSSSDGSLLLMGCSGVGRKTAVGIVAARHGASIVTLNITHTYSLANFKTDLKNVCLNEI